MSKTGPARNEILDNTALVQIGNTASWALEKADTPCRLEVADKAHQVFQDTLAR